MGGNVNFFGFFGSGGGEIGFDGGIEHGAKGVGGDVAGFHFFDFAEHLRKMNAL